MATRVLLARDWEQATPTRSAPALDHGDLPLDHDSPRNGFATPAAEAYGVRWHDDDGGADRRKTNGHARLACNGQDNKSFISHGFDGPSTGASSSKTSSRTSGKRQNRLMLYRDNAFRKSWNGLMILPMAYIATIFPWYLCFVEFQVPRTPEHDEPAWFIIQVVVDSIFGIDMILTFFMTYTDQQGNEVDRHCLIVKRYLTTFFVFDILAIMPGQLWSVLLDQAFCSDCAKMTRFARLPRMSRLVRLSQGGSYTRLLEKTRCWKTFEKGRYFRMIKFTVWLLFQIHLLACGWFLVASLHDPEDHDTTWLARRELLEEEPVVQWIHSMYFVMTVFTTVGFGDISPQRTVETVYVVLVMVVGTVMNGIVVGEMIGVVNTVHLDSVEKKHRSDLLMAFAERAQLSEQSVDELRTWGHYSYAQSKAEEGSKFDKGEMEALISTCEDGDLLARMASGAFHGRFLANGLMRMAQLQPLLPLRLAVRLEQRHCEPSETVYKDGDPAVHVFMVMSGTFAYVTAIPDGKSLVSPITKDGGGSDDEIHAKQATRDAKAKKGGSVHIFTRKLSHKSFKAGRGSDAPEKKKGIGLHPYKLVGSGSYFGDIEIFHRTETHRGETRNTGARCEATLGEETSALLLCLHKEDLMWAAEDMAEVRFQWRHRAKRRFEERRRLLTAFKKTKELNDLAAETVQRCIRMYRRNKRGLSKADLEPQPRLTTGSVQTNQPALPVSNVAAGNGEMHWSSSAGKHLEHPISHLELQVAMNSLREEMRLHHHQVLQAVSDLRSTLNHHR